MAGEKFPVPGYGLGDLGFWVFLGHEGCFFFFGGGGERGSGFGFKGVGCRVWEFQVSWLGVQGLGCHLVLFSGA